MEGRGIKEFCLAVALLVCAAYVSFDVLSSGANEIGRFALYFLVLSVGIGLFAPRVGIIWVFLMSGYVDLFKRLLVISGGFSGVDIIYILGAPGLTISAVVLATIIGRIMGGFVLPKVALWGLFASVVYTAVILIFAVKNGGGFSAVGKAISDEAVYSLMLFLIPVYFPKREDMLELLRKLTWFYVPMAVYLFWQFEYGYAPFERQYLESGYTSTFFYAYDLIERPFSTLNSPHSAGVISVLCFFLSGALIFLHSDKPRGFMTRVILPFGLACMYLSAGFATLNRSCHTVWLVGLFVLFFFQRPGLTVIFYVVGIGLFVLLVSQATWILENIDQATAFIMANGNGSELQEMFLRVGTYSDRLIGFERLVSSDKMWTLFGDPDKFSVYGDVYSHDLIGTTLIRYGAVFTLSMIAIVLWAAYKMHKASYKLPRFKKSLVIVFYALICGLIVVSMLTGSALSIFPVNQFFWMFIAMAVTLVTVEDGVVEEAEISELESPRLSAVGLPFGHQTPKNWAQGEGKSHTRT